MFLKTTFGKHVFSSLQKRLFSTTTEQLPLPLEGIRVLDLGRVLAAPYCTQLLGDQGADIIKIEHPLFGDETRGWGPPFTKEGNQSAYYLCVNRNKRSLALDIKSKKGQNIIYDLVKNCDIWIDNFPNNNLKKYGLDYETISKINKKIVYEKKKISSTLP